MRSKRKKSKSSTVTAMKTVRLPLQRSYPREVFIADECYKVRFKKNLDCYGITDSETKTITIKDGLSPRALLATYIHELLHAVEFEKPIKLPHKLVYDLESAIVEMLVDNFL
jgi:hypothetical protein